MNDRKIRTCEVWDGDIIAVSVLERPENDYASMKWNDRFTLHRRYFYVVKAENNFVVAKDCRGKRRTFGYNEIEAAYRLEGRTA